ncbi:MAG: hypothetical protein KA397_03005 [Paludibacteraceae bacterium]|nr:hypothetical protein [Paludibacteraceae bacterium]MBP6284212.1 hypothetical protein [Paludibacteraceae bacterium]
MKAKSLLIGLLLLSIFTANAQKGVDSGTRYGLGEDSIRCLENISLYQNYYHIKDYNTAFQHWRVVYNECPSSSRDLYRVGSVLLVWQMQNTPDVEKQKDFFRQLMDNYEQRLKYFGDDPRFPESWIRGRQAIDYINYSPEDPLREKALPWLKLSIDERQADADADVIDAYMRLLDGLYQSDNEKYRDMYISEYLRIGKILDTRIARGCKYMGNYKIAQNNSNALFIGSGVASCTTLESVFAQKVQESKTDGEALNTIISLFQSAKCTESEVYFDASVFLHLVNPNAKSAAGMAYQSVKKEDYLKAVDYFEEATTLETVDSLKYEYQYAIAAIHAQMKRYTQARTHALRAATYNPKKGDPYILIAMMYADSNIFPDDKILQKTVYWAAVDKLERARSLDPSSRERAQQLINTYKQYFPNKEEIFFKPELRVGDAFLVGGWINETVICRE